MRTINQLWQVTLLTLRQMMRNNISFFFTLVMPILFMLIFGMMNGGRNMVTSIKVGLVDNDGGPTAQLVQEALSRSGLYEVSPGDEEELTRRLDTGTVRAVVLLPAGLSQRAAQGQAANEVVILWDPTSSSSAAAQGGLQYLLRGLEMGGSAPPLLSAKAQPIASTQSLGLFDFMMPGMLVYMLLNAGVVSIAISVSFQRRQGSMRHMFSTPMTMGNWIYGQILANLLLSVFQLILVWAVGWAVFKVQPPSNLAGTMVILWLSSLVGFGIGLIIGALTKNPEAAQPVALIVAMALTFLGNAMIPLDGAPPIVLLLMKLMPSYYMTHSLQQVMMKGQALGSVLYDLSILALTAAICLSIASWRLRKLFVTTA